MHLRDDWSSEIQLLLRAILFKLSIWDHNASYGAALQNLQYTDARKAGPLLVSPSKWQKTLYAFVTVGGRYVWEKWEDYLIDHEREVRFFFPLHLRRLKQPDPRLRSSSFKVFEPCIYDLFLLCLHLLPGIPRKRPLPHPP